PGRPGPRDGLGLGRLRRELGIEGPGERVVPAPAAQRVHAVRLRKNSVNLSMASSRNPPTFPRKSPKALAVPVGLCHIDRTRKAAAVIMNAFFKSMTTCGLRPALPAPRGHDHSYSSDALRAVAMTDRAGQPAWWAAWTRIRPARLRCRERGVAGSSRRTGAVVPATARRGDD